MPKIKSSTDLRNNYHSISTLCHESREPVFITRNGQGDLAIMSIDLFEEITNQLNELRKSANENLFRLFANKKPQSALMPTVEEKRAAMQRVRELMADVEGSKIDLKQIREERRMAKYGHYI